MSDSKTIQCPKCKQQSKILLQNQPTQITCPGCQTKLRIPALAPSPAPQASPQSAAANPFAQPSAPAPQEVAPQNFPTPGAPLASTNPYQAPHPGQATHPSGASLPPPTAPHRSGHYVKKPLKVLGWMSCSCVLLTSVSGLLISMLETIGEAMFPGFNSPNVEASQGLEVALFVGIFLLAILTLFVYLAAAVTTCMFLYRASANLHAANVPNMQHTPGWAAGSWFVPILNLVRPFQVTKEIWERSGNGTSNITTGGSVLGVWWGFWLLGNFLGQIESRAALRGWDLGPMALPLSWASSLVSLVAGICFFMIVRGIMRRQSV